MKQQVKPWITIDIRNSTKRMGKLYKKYLKAKNENLKEEYDKKYKELKI